MGGDEQAALHALHRVQCLQVGGYVVDEGDVVFFQGGRTAQAVRQKHGVIGRPEPVHLEEMAGQRDDLKAAGKVRVREGGYAAGLGHEKFVAQLSRRKTAVQEGRFQDGAFGEMSFDSLGKNFTAGFLLDKMVSADVVRVGVGVDNPRKTPSALFQDPQELASRVLVVSAVDQVDLVVP